MADSQTVIFTGWEKNRPEHSYLLGPSDSEPRPITPEGTWCNGAMGRRWLPCFREEEDHGRSVPVWELRSVDGRESRPAPWIGSEANLIAWSPDDRYAFVLDHTRLRFQVSRVDVATGHREPWLDTGPPDPAGVALPGVAASGVISQYITPDGRRYAYSYVRTLSDLFVVEGLR